MIGVSMGFQGWGSGRFRSTLTSGGVLREMQHDLAAHRRNGSTSAMSIIGHFAEMLHDALLVEQAKASALTVGGVASVLSWRPAEVRQAIREKRFLHTFTAPDRQPRIVLNDWQVQMGKGVKRGGRNWQPFVSLRSSGSCESSAAYFGRMR